MAERVQAHDYHGALQLLDSLEQEHAEDYSVQRLKGICYLELGQLSDAETSLRKALSLEAASPATHYYLAQALAYQGKLIEAASFLQKTTELAPESSYARKARSVLPGLQNLTQASLVMEGVRRWDVYLRVAGEYDDNVPARSRHEGQTGTDSLRLTSMVYAQFRVRDQKLESDWPTIGTGYSFYQSLHEANELSGFDVTSHNLNLELSRFGDLRGHAVELSVNGSYNETELSNDPFSEVVSVEAEGQFQVNPTLRLVGRYGAAWKEFDEDTEFPNFFSRDGTQQEIGSVLYAYLFQNRVILGLDYSYLWNNVDGSQFELKQHRVATSLTAYLPARMLLQTRFEFSTEDYDEFVPDPQRLDDLYTLYTSLSRPVLNESVRAEANITYSTSDSNQDFADYDRTVYGMALSYTF